MTETSSQCSAPVEPSPDSCPCGRGPLQRQQSLAGVAHASASSALRTTTNRPQTQTSVCGIHPRPAALLGQWGAWMPLVHSARWRHPAPRAAQAWATTETPPPTTLAWQPLNSCRTLLAGLSGACCPEQLQVLEASGRNTSKRHVLPAKPMASTSSWPLSWTCFPLGGRLQPNLLEHADWLALPGLIVLGFLRSQNVRIDSHFRSWNVSMVFSTNILLPITLLIACFSLFVVSGVDVTGVFHAAVQLSREFPCPSTCLSSDYIIISLNLPSTPYIYTYTYNIHMDIYIYILAD